MNSKFNVGDTVKIVKTTKYSYQKTVGCIGKICKRSEYKGTCSYAVKVDGFVNSYCGSGNFIYNERELIKLEIGDDTMESKYILHGLKSIVKVEFINNSTTRPDFANLSPKRTINYLCFDEFIELEDSVVVKTANHGFGIAIVREIITDPDKMYDLATADNTINREIVGKFDIRTFWMRADNRVRMANNDAKRKKLMAAMDKRIAESRNMAYYEKMAESDNEIKTMLEQLKAIK
jgi:hypothetical protein